MTVAVTSDDEDNVVISLLAKQEFAVPRVIARVSHPKNHWLFQNHWLFNESWGVELVSSTPQLPAGLVEEAVSVGVLARLSQFERGNTRPVEVTLAAGSPAAGAAVGDLGPPCGSTSFAMFREGRLVVPRADTYLDTDDAVLVLAGANTDDEELRALLTSPRERA